MLQSRYLLPDKFGLSIYTYLGLSVWPLESEQVETVFVEFFFGVKAENVLMEI